MVDLDFRSSASKAVVVSFQTGGRFSSSNIVFNRTPAKHKAIPRSGVNHGPYQEARIPRANYEIIPQYQIATDNDPHIQL